MLKYNSFLSLRGYVESKIVIRVKRLCRREKTKMENRKISKVSDWIRKNLTLLVTLAGVALGITEGTYIVSVLANDFSVISRKKNRLL